MSRQTKVCPHCQQRFIPHPRLGRRQKSCGLQACKRAQKRLSHRRWKQREKEDYRKNQADWRAEHPEYWREYRRTHPEYTDRNREQAKVRKAMRKLGLQKRIDILQLPDKQGGIWNFRRFAKLPRSIIPIIWAYYHAHELESHRQSQAPRTAFSAQSGRENRD